MKKRFSRILGVGLAVALLTSLMMVAVPASALSQPVVTFAVPFFDDVISKVDANYTITFTLGKELAGGDTIVITLPSDTAVGTVTANISASPGWVGGVWTNPTLSNPSGNWTGSTAFRTITKLLLTGDAIGEAATVRINITLGITNPTTAGSYTLTVATYRGTAAREAAVTSAAYTMVVPLIPALGGLVSLYNPGNVLMGQYLGSGGVANAAGNITGTGWTVKIGPGTYTETIVTGKDSTTFVATGTAAETIIQGSWTINNASTTISGLTLKGALTVNKDKVNIKNCSISKLSGTAVETLVTYANDAAVLPSGTIDTCTLDTTFTYGATLADTAIDVTKAGLTVTGCTLKLGATDTGIKVSANNAGVTVKNCPSISGAGATGLYVTQNATTTSIEGTTFDSLSTALKVDGGTVTLKTSTVKASGGTAIDIPAVMGTTVVYIKGNTIQDTKAALVPPGYYALSVGANASGKVWMLFNNITGNAANVVAGTGVVVDASHNWWGAATGPALGTVSGLGVVTLPYLGGAVTTSADIATAAASLVAKTTANVDVAIVLTSTGAPSPAGIIAVGNYAANPTTVAPLYTALAKGYYDVYVGSPANMTDIVTIMFYNSAVTKDSVAYMWSALKGMWVKMDTQGVNLVGGYVFVTIKGGAVSSIVDLAGTPFVLVTEKPVPGAATLTSPALGAYNIAIKPTFTWSAITGVIRYEFALSEDSAFKILKWSANVVPNMYAAPEELKYSTTYYWRVRGITAEPYLVGPTWVTPATDWATGIFTTAAEPVPVEPTVVEVPAPKVDVTVEPAKVTVEPSPPVIPDYMLWTIIGVGAVLVIALIVLIVRTRRTA